MALTLEQQRALARARARMRMAESQRQQPQQAAPAATPQGLPPTSDAMEAASALNAFNRGIPVMRDLQHVMRGVATAAPEVLDTQPGDYFGRIRGAYGRGVDRQRQDEQYLDADANARHPLGNQLAQGAGGALPVALTMGAAAPETAAASLAPRAAPLGFFGRTAVGGATGALYGDIYGVGTSDGDLPTRLQAGTNAMLPSAAFGAAMPAAGGAIRAATDFTRPAWEALGGLGRYLPTADPNALGAMGGNLRRMPPPRRPPPRPSPLSPATQRRLPVLADRARMSAEDVANALGEAQRNPQGQALVDVFDTAGLRQLAPIVQAPGRTGALAANIAETRSAASPDILNQGMRRGLGVNKTPGAAMDDLGERFRQVSTEGYTPVLRQSLSAEQRANLQNAWRPFERDRVFQDAQRRAREIFDRDVSLGRVTGGFEENPARYAHYLKLGMDAAVDAAPIGSRGLQAAEMNGVREMRNRLVQSLDDNIPGYRDARAQWGSLAEARDALTEGETFLRMNSEDVQRRVAQMTPFQRDHARIGFAHKVSEQIGLGGNSFRPFNVANLRLFRAPEMQARMRSLFRTPEEAADYIENVVHVQNRLVGNAIAWGGGSPTQGRLAHEADGVAATMAEIAGSALHGPGHAINVAGRKMGNLVLNHAVEQSNNQFGEDLLRRVDSPSDFSNEVIRLLREREAARWSSQNGTQAAARAGGATVGRRRN